MIPQMTTQRLIMRGFCESDLDAYAEMCANPEVMRYIGAGQPLSRNDAWRNMAMIVGHWQIRGYGMWAVEESQTGEMIGRVGFWHPEGWPGMEIGWSLRRAYWGFGFATEAATAAMNYAFTQLERSHLMSLIHPQNFASMHVAEKIGEKLQSKTEVLGTEVLVYGISREEWQMM